MLRIDWDNVDGPKGIGYTYTYEYCYILGMIGDKLCVIAKTTNPD